MPASRTSPRSPSERTRRNGQAGPARRVPALLRCSPGDGLPPAPLRLDEKDSCSFIESGHWLDCARQPASGQPALRSPPASLAPASPDPHDASLPGGVRVLGTLGGSRGTACRRVVPAERMAWRDTPWIAQAGSPGSGAEDPMACGAATGKWYAGWASVPSIRRGHEAIQAPPLEPRHATQPRNRRRTPPSVGRTRPLPCPADREEEFPRGVDTPFRRLTCAQQREEQCRRETALAWGIATANRGNGRDIGSAGMALHRHARHASRRPQEGNASCRPAPVQHLRSVPAPARTRGMVLTAMDRPGPPRRPPRRTGVRPRWRGAAPARPARRPRTVRARASAR
jgi:hypothetical protein